MRKSILLLVAVALATACGQSGGTPVEGTIEVTAVDYSFEGVPALVAPGAELTLTNNSEAEVHEMIVIGPIPGTETRTLEELLEAPEEETDFAFQGVQIALPGEDGASPEDQSTSITVTEPGRYAVVCFIPQGTDVAAFEAAIAAADPNAEGPPPFGDGTPHAFLGMAAEFTVEG